MLPPHEGLGKQAGKSFGVSGNPHRKRRMDFKDLNRKKISLGKCHWKVKKAEHYILQATHFVVLSQQG